MATRSHIAMRLGPSGGGPVAGVYCHHDGYPSNNGLLLMNFWNNAKDVHRLLCMGSMSSLGKEIGEQAALGLDAPSEQCLFYMRDRGDAFMADEWANDAEFFSACYPDGDIEFQYLYIPGTGWVINQPARSLALLGDYLLGTKVVSVKPPSWDAEPKADDLKKRWPKLSPSLARPPRRRLVG